MAVSLVGETQPVMAEMGCSNEDFLDYCAARKEPSAQEFDRLIKMLIREQGNLIAKNRELIAKIRAAQDARG
jgi:hypothetical protein